MIWRDYYMDMKKSIFERVWFNTIRQWNRNSTWIHACNHIWPPPPNLTWFKQVPIHQGWRWSRNPFAVAQRMLHTLNPKLCGLEAASCQGIGRVWDRILIVPICSKCVLIYAHILITSACTNCEQIGFDQALQISRVIWQASALRAKKCFTVD